MQMAKFALLGFVLASSTTLADELRIPIPEQNWEVKLEAPFLNKLQDSSGPNGYTYTANAGRLNLSLNVGPPLCGGDGSNQELYRCFGERLQRVPGILPRTIQASEQPNGVQIAYLTQTRVEGRTIRMFHIHLLFTREGNWAQMHVSVIQPTKDDLEKVAAMVISTQAIERGN